MLGWVFLKLNHKRVLKSKLANCLISQSSRWIYYFFHCGFVTWATTLGLHYMCCHRSSVRIWGLLVIRESQETKFANFWLSKYQVILIVFNGDLLVVLVEILLYGLQLAFSQNLEALVSKGAMKAKIS